MTLTAVVAVVVAFGLDTVFAEPPARIHPVAWFGRVVGACDRTWRPPRLTGGVVAVVLPLATAAVASATVGLASSIVPSNGLGPLVVLGGIPGLWLFAATSRRMLRDAARDLLNDIETEPGQARKSIRALVGRDAIDLSPAELRSGAVESAAVNLADAIVAPLIAFELGAQLSLSVAAAAAVWVKAVNTLDSMLGYPSIPHGTASARLDVLVIWLPARVSAGLLSFASVDLTAPIRAARWADVPPSPNSGWPIVSPQRTIGMTYARLWACNSAKHELS